jgi:hypothetical protein
MDCRRPQVLELPYMLTGTPSAGSDRYVLANFPAGPNEIAAVEIDASSELDCCIVNHAGGNAFCAVGAPVLGPLTGPLLIKPWRRVMPFTNDGQGYHMPPLIETPPILALKVHFDMPPVFQTRRAPMIRTAPDSSALVAGYAPVAEFPLYGRASARLMFTNGGANSLTYKVNGRQYRAKDSVTEQADNPIGSSATAGAVQLVLDGSGSIELAVAAGVTVSVTFTGEPFDTLELHGKSAAGSVAAGILYQASGEI